MSGRQVDGDGWWAAWLSFVADNLWASELTKAAPANDNRTRKP